MVRAYLDIERVRFGDRLRYDVRLDPGTASAANQSVNLTFSGSHSKTDVLSAIAVCDPCAPDAFFSDPTNFIQTWGFGASGQIHRYAFTDIAPKEDPERDFTLLLPEEGDLAVSVRADFALDLLGLEPAGGARIFVHQGTIVGSRRLLEPRPAPAPRGPGAAEGGPPH